MRFRLLASLAIAAAFVMSGMATAQESAPEASEAEGRAANVRFEIAIADEGGGAAPTEKQVTVVISTGGWARARSVHAGEPPEPGMVPPAINVDIGGSLDPVRIMDDGSIQVAVVIAYRPYVPGMMPRPSGGELSTIRFFEDGVPAQLARLTEVASERQTTITVTATVLDRGQ